MPFGCPVYVLENQLQGASRIHNKWEYRSRVGIYLGRSPNHGRNIAMVLDRVTGLVLPQFHVAFDPSFRTVEEDEFDTSWQVKAGFLSEKSLIGNKAKKRATSETIFIRNNATEPEGDQACAQQSAKRSKTSATASNAGTSQRQRENLEIPPDDSQSGNNETQPLDGDSMEQDASQGQSPSKSRAGGDQQTLTPAQRITNVMVVELSMTTAGDIDGEIYVLEAMFPDYAGNKEMDPLQVFKATSDPDTMYLHQAMKQPDAPEFKKAMQKEWDDQINNGNFTVIHRSKV